MPSQSEVTQLLIAWSQGNQEARDELARVVQEELRRLAESYLGRESLGHTLQPTALVNEVYLRLINADQIQWQDRKHFFGVAARAMRQILVDHARHHHRLKRGGDAQRVTLSGIDEPRAPAQVDVDLLALDEALARLAALNEQQSRIVELRFFGDLTHEEIAELLQVSPSTVKREWRLARAFLFGEINRKQTPVKPVQSKKE